MTHLLLLGATGRTGNAILRQLSAYEDIQVTAAIRDLSDISRLPKTTRPFQTAIVDIEQIDSLRKATENVEVIVNAIRFRGNIPSSTWIELDKRIRASIGNLENRLMITVGGAGSLHIPHEKRFWQHAAFPKPTLPRGMAHSMLRDYLEDLSQTESWAYLIPPPAYLPAGPLTGSYQQWSPSKDESDFLTKSISYEDFAIAVCDASKERWTGTHLIAENEPSI